MGYVKKHLSISEKTWERIRGRDTGSRALWDVHGRFCKETFSGDRSCRAYSGKSIGSGKEFSRDSYNSSETASTADQGEIIIELLVAAAIAVGYNKLKSKKGGNS